MKEKNTKKKQIDAKDITSSPYFVAGLMGVCIALAIAMVVYFVININNTKTQITEARRLYVASVQEVDVLENLKKKSEQAQAQLDEYDSLLPESVGDAYVVQDDVITKFENFGLDVTAISFINITNETSEIVFTVNCTGSFDNIYNVINYYTNLEHIHRIDSLSLVKDESTGNYSAVITLAILSENAATGVVAIADSAA